MTRRLSRYASWDDFAAHAKRRLPRAAFDYLDGGAGDGAGVTRNRQALRDIRLVPRFLTDVSQRDLSREVLGRTYALPLGVAPVGLANFIWPGADATLAGIAREAGIPYLLSTAGTTSIERIAPIACENFWFQLYIAQDHDVTLDLLRRAREAGAEVVVVTIDSPCSAPRNRDIRNDFTLPFRPSPAMALDIALRPAWLAAMVRQGAPLLANVQPYAEKGGGTASLAAYVADHITPRLDAALLSRVRDAWPGKFIVKGVMSVADAKAAFAAGADGIIVSNHGGRMVEDAPATVTVLAAIRAALGPEPLVMMDSGITSGASIATAYSQGADFVFAGRIFLYALAAAGAPGVRRLLGLLQREMDQMVGLLGRTSLTGSWGRNLAIDAP